MSAVALAACSGDGGGSGGAGGGAGGGDGGSGGATASTTSSTGGAGVGGGTGGGDNGFADCVADALNDDAECAGCAAIITSDKCGPEHGCDLAKQLLTAAQTCACGADACATECADSCTGGAPASEACKTCSAEKCPDETNACVADTSEAN